MENPSKMRTFILHTKYFALCQHVRIKYANTNKEKFKIAYIFNMKL